MLTMSSNASGQVACAALYLQQQSINTQKQCLKLGVRSAVLLAQVDRIHVSETLQVFFGFGVAGQLVDVGGGGRAEDGEDDVELV